MLIDIDTSSDWLVSRFFFNLRSELHFEDSRF